jgi:hypothetical protein
VLQYTSDGNGVHAVKYWLQDLKGRDHFGDCAVIRSGLY